MKMLPSNYPREPLLVKKPAAAARPAWRLQWQRGKAIKIKTEEGETK